jgi:putative DNA primase/helicase
MSNAPLDVSQIKARAQGSWPAILAGLGVEARYLRNRHGPCPACGGKDRFRYDLKSDMGSYFCSGCGAGTGIHLLALTQQISHQDAWRKVESVIGMAIEIKPVATDYRKRIKEILSSCQPHHYGIMDAYFASRGLETPQNAFLGKYYLENTLTDCIVLKAAKGNKLAGLHCTYLRDGKKVGRRMYCVEEGSMNGSAIRLSSIANSDTLLVGEGVETVLSAMKLTGLPGWAAMDAGKLEKVEIPKHIKRVVIASDNDHSFTGQASAYLLAKRLKVSGLDTRVMIPADTGKDFNDVLLNK